METEPITQNVDPNLLPSPPLNDKWNRTWNSGSGFYDVNPRPVPAKKPARSGTSSNSIRQITGTSTRNPPSSQDHDIPFWTLIMIEYLPWETRAKLPTLSKSWRQNTSTLAYYRFLCQRLAVEHLVYIPVLPPQGETWRTLFSDMFKLRKLWSAAPSEVLGTQRAQTERFKISVFAKFRPNSETKSKVLTETGVPAADEQTEAKAVTLPLHQKLALIRMARKLTSNKQALQILTEEGSWFSEKWASTMGEGAASAQPSDKKFTTDDNALQTHQRSILQRRGAFSRKGAASTKESGDGSQMVSKVQSLDPFTGQVVLLTADVGLREFSFDGVLPGAASQRLSYDTCVKRLVVDLLNGFNATALVYGQTGAGKTFSMFGRDEDSVFGADQEGQGIIPRACEEILAAVQQRQTQGVEAQLCVSYVEVYGDHVSDLLRQGARCGHSKVAAQRYVLNGAAETAVHSMEDVRDLLRKGEQQKRKAATAMNDRSTRAHSLFILTLKQRQSAGVGAHAVTLQTRLFLADLGGSEQVKKSQVEAGAHRVTDSAQQFSAGFQLAERMRETVNINLGLLALKKVIESLQQKMSYVPYQDSKLTMLLSEGLGGNCKTSVIVCANLDPTHASETLASLRFGERCAQVEQRAQHHQANLLASILADLDAQIAALEAEILRKERWEVVEVRREDVLAEEGTLEKALGGHEVLRPTRVVGAETERRLLADLLRQRRQFTGQLDQAADWTEEPAEAAEEAAGAQVLAFGGRFAAQYGFGDAYDAERETDENNERFRAAVRAEQMPKQLQRGRRKVYAAWATGESPATASAAEEPLPVSEAEQATFRRSVQQANKKRAKLAYSGLSA